MRQKKKHLIKLSIAYLILIIFGTTYNLPKYEEQKVEKIKTEETVLFSKPIIADQFNPITYQLKDVPKNRFKSFMPYTSITSKSSKQYQLQQYAITDKNGLRVVNSRYCIAMGSYYSVSVGDYIDLLMEDGQVIKCILGDCKDNRDTDVINQMTTNGCMSEFIVDMDELDSNVMLMGDVSALGGIFNQSIVSVIIYDNNFFDQRSN